MTQSPGGIVFIPGLGAGRDEGDGGIGTLLGCVCFVLDGKTLILSVT